MRARSQVSNFSLASRGGREGSHHQYIKISRSRRTEPSRKRALSKGRAVTRSQVKDSGLGDDALINPNAFEQERGRSFAQLRQEINRQTRKGKSVRRKGTLPVVTDEGTPLPEADPAVPDPTVQSDNLPGPSTPFGTTTRLSHTSLQNILRDPRPAVRDLFGLSKVPQPKLILSAEDYNKSVTAAAALPPIPGGFDTTENPFLGADTTKASPFVTPDSSLQIPAQDLPDPFDKIFQIEDEPKSSPSKDSQKSEPMSQGIGQPSIEEML